MTAYVADPVNWQQVVTTLLLVAGPTGLGWWWLNYRQDRREQKADARDEASSDVNIVVVLLEQQRKQQDQIADLYERWIASQQMAADARADAAGARAEATSAVAVAAEANKEVHTLRSTLARVVAHFRPVLQWIDAGAIPPPPPIPQDVRAILFDESPRPEDTLG